MRLSKKICYTSLMLCLSVLASWSAAAAKLDCNAPTCGKTFYYNASRTEYSKFNDQYWIVGHVYPDHPLPNQTDGSMSFEPVMVSLSNCSNKMFRCITGLGKVFAIPRSHFIQYSAYTIHGSLLKIEKCLQGNLKVCQVALISSSCQKALNGGCVIPGLQDGARSEIGNYNGPSLYFIYNEDVGVTSYGEAGKRISDLKVMMSTATQFILNGDVGLLSSAAKGDLEKPSRTR